jgi:hypothetical protein
LLDWLLGDRTMQWPNLKYNRMLCYTIVFCTGAGGLMVIRSYSVHFLNKICTHDQKHHAVSKHLNLVDHGLLDCDAMKSCKWLPKLWRNIWNYKSTWHQNPQDHILQFHCHEYFNSYLYL